MVLVYSSLQSILEYQKETLYCKLLIVKKQLISINTQPLFPPNHLIPTLLFISGLPFMDISCKLNHTVHGLL